MVVFVAVELVLATMESMVVVAMDSMDAMAKLEEDVVVVVVVA